MDDTLREYLPILILLAMAVGLGLVLILAAAVIAVRNPDPEKVSAYECGFNAFDDARMKFDVRFYLVSILFIIFDLEVAFLFPWAVAFGDMSMVGVLVDDGVPGRADRSALPMNGRRGRWNGSDAEVLGAGDNAEVATQALNRELQDKGFLLTSTEDHHQLGAHRVAALDDLRSGLLRGRDDAHLDAAL